MTWDAAASRGRHRAPEPEPEPESEPEPVDALIDTVAISVHSATYGRHAAHPAGPAELRPVTMPQRDPADAVPAEPEPYADEQPSVHPLGRLAGYLLPWTARRSA